VVLVGLKPISVTNWLPSVFLHCWLGHLNLIARGDALPEASIEGWAKAAKSNPASGGLPATAEFLATSSRQFGNKILQPISCTGDNNDAGTK